MFNSLCAAHPCRDTLCGPPYTKLLLIATPMNVPFSCCFELPTPESAVVMDALRADDMESPECIEYAASGTKLVVKITCEDFRGLMKTATFFMERFKLSSDTLQMCNKPS